MKKYRKHAGLTQEELASKADVRRETIARLEAAKFCPSLKLAVDISRVLDVPLDELFEFEQ